MNQLFVKNKECAKPSTKVERSEFMQHLSMTEPEVTESQIVSQYDKNGCHADKIECSKMTEIVIGDESDEISLLEGSEITKHYTELTCKKAETTPDVQQQSLLSDDTEVQMLEGVPCMHEQVLHADSQKRKAPPDEVATTNVELCSSESRAKLLRLINNDGDIETIEIHQTNDPETDGAHSLSSPASTVELKCEGGETIETFESVHQEQSLHTDQEYAVNQSEQSSEYNLPFVSESLAYDSVKQSEEQSFYPQGAAQQNQTESVKMQTKEFQEDSLSTTTVAGCLNGESLSQTAVPSNHESNDNSLDSCTTSVTDDATHTTQQDSTASSSMAENTETRYITESYDGTIGSQCFTSASEPEIVSASNVVAFIPDATIDTQGQPLQDACSTSYVAQLENPSQMSPQNAPPLPPASSQVTYSGSQPLCHPTPFVVPGWQHWHGHQPLQRTPHPSVGQIYIPPSHSTTFPTSHGHSYYACTDQPQQFVLATPPQMNGNTIGGRAPGYMPRHNLVLNSSGSDENISPPDVASFPRTPHNTPVCGLQSPATPLTPNMSLNVHTKLFTDSEDSPKDEKGRHMHNVKERMRRARIKKAGEQMRLVVPGLGEKTDKATVFEVAAEYIMFLKDVIGRRYDDEFLRRVGYHYPPQVTRTLTENTL